MHKVRGTEMVMKAEYDLWQDQMSGNPTPTVYSVDLSVWVSFSAQVWIDQGWRGVILSPHTHIELPSTLR